jgi:formylmethanofuran dehydrogenase subunit B
LTDAEHYNPGFVYFDKVLSNITFDNIYIATDDPGHEIIQKILNKYENVSIVDYDIVDTIKFGSTCSNVILSHGTFSAIIGYLSFFSTVYYCKYEYGWHGDIFSIPNWICIEK